MSVLAAASVDRLNEWSLRELPGLNRAVFSGELRLLDLVGRLRGELVALPEPESFGSADVRRLLVLLGFIGSSVARHRQEQDLSLKEVPERSFASLPLGPGGTPFLDYYARLGALVGHPRRFCFASMVWWNMPEVEVFWEGRLVGGLPSVFADGAVRSYTGAVGEYRLMEINKKCGAVEEAVNRCLAPLHEGEVRASSEEGLGRLHQAAGLLDVVRALLQEFEERPPGQGMDVDYFMDVQRQFDVHWEAADVPPSAAQDAEFLKRDLILGLDVPGYASQIQRMFPALLQVDRDALLALADRVTLPEVVLGEVGLSAAGLAAMGRQELCAVVRRHPQVAACHLLGRVHAAVSGVHVKITQKYLFAPTRRREEAGIGDNPLVSNLEGATGIGEERMKALTKARRRTPLRALNAVPVRELVEVARLRPLVTVDVPDIPSFVRFAAGSADAPLALEAERPRHV
ncbi:hypothetical protein GCM10027589_15290 [Actinocorallia lasiicapitis]